MTIRTFWTIFIKILGIWLVLDSITVIPQFLSSLFMLGSNSTEENMSFTIALFILIIAIYIFILRLFVFKTAWIIDKLELDKGFTEENINLEIKYSTILSIATIVIGGIMFIDSLPQLCKQTFGFFQQKSIFRNSPDSIWIIFHLVKTIIGYVVMTNSKSIVAFIEKQNSQKN